MQLQKIISLIESKYDLGEITLEGVIRDGIDNKVYKIANKSNEKFVLRENKRSFINKNPEFEIELIKKLNALNFNTPKLITTSKKEAKVELGKSTFLIFEHIEGEQFEKIDKEMISSGLVELGGEMLGKLHKETFSFNLKNESIRNIFTEFKRLKDADQKKLSEFDGFNKLKYFIEIFTEEGEKRISNKTFTGAIHNDYYPGNLIYTNNKSCYLIDFDWSCQGPFIKDLALGVGSWSSSFEGKSPPDKEVINRFLCGYNLFSPLKVNYDKDLLFWICFAFLSETATFFVDVLESRWSDLNIERINQCFSYRKFEYFFEEYSAI